MARKKESDAVIIEKEKSNREFFNGFKDITITLARSPLMQMLMLVIAVKTLEKIQINEEPFLDSFWATTILTTGIGSKALETIGGSLENALNIIQAVKPTFTRYSQPQTETQYLPLVE